MAIQEIIADDFVITKSNKQQVPATKTTMDDLELFMNLIVDPETGRVLEYIHLISDKLTCKTWEQKEKNEFGRLMKGLPKRGNFWIINNRNNICP